MRRWAEVQLTVLRVVGTGVEVRQGGRWAAATEAVDGGGRVELGQVVGAVAVGGQRGAAETVGGGSLHVADGAGAFTGSNAQ